MLNAKDTGNPISQSFVDACVELGYPELDDFNAGSFGAGWHHVDIRDGKRCGVRVGYLEPALDRANLTVHTGTMVTSLLFEGNRCVGVSYLRDGQTRTVRAGLRTPCTPTR